MLTKVSACGFYYSMVLVGLLSLSWISVMSFCMQECEQFDFTILVIVGLLNLSCVLVCKNANNWFHYDFFGFESY